MIQKKNTTAIILAGGKSSRMGSDKGLLKLNGTTFLSRIIDAVSPLVHTTLLVSSNLKYDVFQQKRIEDLIINAGPLGGLFTGLFYSETPYNLVLSCDVPLITTNLLRQLFEASNSDADVNQFESNGLSIPLVAIYKKQCMHPCLEQLKKGERRMRKAVAQLNTHTIQLDPDLEPFVRNINTPAELKAIKNEIEY